MVACLVATVCASVGRCGLGSSNAHGGSVFKEISDGVGRRESASAGVGRDCDQVHAGEGE